MIFQLHNEHGKHIAYSEHEAKLNEKNGWKTVSEEVFYSDCYKNDIVEAYIKKFGKKPHHKMKPETIEAALNGDS